MSIFPKFHKDWAKIVEFLLGHSDFKIAFLIKLRLYKHYLILLYDWHKKLVLCNQVLSQNPNSLSNLDQDLPNNMIHQVPIFSLPQEWLYCETWCDRSTLAQAKSKDLCNNPLTKEPKLDAARRIVTEWTAYDDEMSKLAEEIKLNASEKSGKSTSTVDHQHTHTEL